LKRKIQTSNQTKRTSLYRPRKRAQSFKFSLQNLRKTKDKDKNVFICMKIQLLVYLFLKWTQKNWIDLALVWGGKKGIPLFDLSLLEIFFFLQNSYSNKMVIPNDLYNNKINDIKIITIKLGFLHDFLRKWLLNSFF